MTATPNNRAGRLTERIMSEIRYHLLPDREGQPTHYNAVYSAVLQILSNDPVASGAVTDPLDAPANRDRPPILRCDVECATRWTDGRRCRHNRINGERGGV